VAIKGRTRRRSRSRARALPPRPQVSPRRTPLPFRRDVKRAAVIVLAVLSLLGGLRLWQNIARADALRRFDRALQRAQQPLLAHFDPNAVTNFQSTIQQFSEGKVSADQFRGVTELWEKDFKAAEDAVKRLRAPNEVAAQAKDAIVEGLDAYVGVARLYNVAAQVKKLAEGARDPALKKALEDQVQVVLQHASEWRARADRVYDLGNKRLQALKVRYGLESPLPTG
jgi:hypothetical protein